MVNEDLVLRKASSELELLSKTTYQLGRKVTEESLQSSCVDSGMLLWVHLSCLEVRYWQHPQHIPFSGLATRTWGQTGDGAAEGFFPSFGPALPIWTCLVTTRMWLRLITSLGLILTLTLTCRLTLQLDLGPASSPQLA